MVNAPCIYCQKPASGKYRDGYGELMLQTKPLVVCKDCHDDLQNEDGPWNDW